MLELLPRIRKRARKKRKSKTGPIPEEVASVADNPWNDETHILGPVT
jgi:hypothetical protein